MPLAANECPAPSGHERPILFTAAMIQALLAGRKSQTRRLMKPQPNNDLLVKDAPWEVYVGHDGLTRAAQCTAQLLKCPYGKVADHLWVREAWKPDWSEVDIQYQADDAFSRRLDQEAWFEADYRKRKLGSLHPAWRPSTRMPRWASRLTLEITGIRVEQVQDITVDDIYGEGVRAVRNGKMLLIHSPETDAAYQEDWQRLWDSTNGKKPGAQWQDNPWVWAIDFLRLSHDEKEASA